MIKSSHFRDCVVIPTLTKMARFDPRLATPSSVNLMMGVAAQETDLGYYLTQHPTGPGRGPYSIEQPTHLDVVRYLNRESNIKLRRIIVDMVRRGADLGDEEELTDNLAYSTAIARVRLWYIPEPLADADDIEGHGDYWNRNYNGNPDFGTVAEFVDSWKQFVETD